MMVNFLGIGAQKAGTTWLYHILKTHSEIYMPPRKELHYFDRSTKYPSPSLLSTSSLKDRLLGYMPDQIEFREYMANELSSRMLCNDLESQWYHKYYLGEYNDEWYCSLFEDAKGRLAGEITPAYSILDIEDVKYIKNLFPELKIIFLIRDPIERAWSHIRFFKSMGKLSFPMSDHEAIKDFIISPKQKLRGDYPNIIKTWHTVFGTDAVFIGFYDEIEKNPENLLYNICHFLNIDYAKFNFSEKMLFRHINVSESYTMPIDVKQFLIEFYQDDIKRLANIFNSYPNKWLGKYNILPSD